jgi:folate-dependent phosphoribosylglycinamide formyltransferase PurN
MSKATPVLINAFLGINVHPADLSVKTPEGKRKYTGDKAVEKAVRDGAGEIRSSVHIVAEKVDYGRILRVSAPLQVILPPNLDFKDDALVKQIAKEHQDRLKEVGDWVIFPQTLLDIAEGRFAEGLEGRLFFNRVPIPDGVRLE